MIRFLIFSSKFETLFYTTSIYRTFQRGHRIIESDQICFISSNLYQKQINDFHIIICLHGYITYLSTKLLNPFKIPVYTFQRPAPHRFLQAPTVIIKRRQPKGANRNIVCLISLVKPRINVKNSPLWPGPNQPSQIMARDRADCPHDVVTVSFFTQQV